MNAFKFRLPKKSEVVYLVDSYMTNAAWLFDVAWLETVKQKDAAALLKYLNKKRVAVVTAKLQGQRVPTPMQDLGELVAKTNLAGYHAIDLRKMTSQVLFNEQKEDTSQPRVQRVFLKAGKMTVEVDAGYFPLLFFDRSTVVMIKDETSAVIVKTADGKIVAMLMPMRRR